MGILVKKAGPLTTIQDLGRWGYQSQGVSVGGAMDVRSLKIANMLLDNDWNEAALEFALMGPQVEFTSNAVIALTGGDFRPMVGSRPVPRDTALAVKAGEVLTFGAAASGSWGYLAVAGGFDIPEVLGSRSTNLKARLGRAVAAGDTLAFRGEVETLPYLAYRSVMPERYEAGGTLTLRIVPGPQTACFTAEGIRTFLEAVYTITDDFDRMGCRLAGTPIETKETADILSDGIALGAIQVTNQGQPIILLSDRQTTGGYAKIAVVISADIPRLVQARPGDTVRFVPVTVEEAQRIYREEEAQLRSRSAAWTKAGWHPWTGAQRGAAMEGIRCKRSGSFGRKRRQKKWYR